MKKQSKKKAAVIIRDPNKQDLNKNGLDRLRDDDKNFDFGGLPDRNLKKNLGC